VGDYSENHDEARDRYVDGLFVGNIGPGIALSQNKRPMGLIPIRH
jgi:hypothetical protein